MPLFVVAWVMFGAAEAQTTIPVTPSQPTSFKKRNLGSSLGSTGAGVGVGPRNPKRIPAKPVYKTVQYIGIAAERNWTSHKGKVIRGTLLAFENGPKESVVGQLTLIRDGNIRLLRTGTNRPSVIALDMLSPEDQKFVRDLDVVNRNQGEAQKIESAKAKT
ncbi:MAG: hypothetical protein R3F19_17645 [Verrucomicrobiales bacterium]